MEQSIEINRPHTIGETAQLDLSLIVPAHNEESNLSPLVARLRRTMLENGIDGEIIIVDDGSTDKTPIVAQTIVKQYGGVVKYVRHRIQAGKSTALQTGFDESHGKVIAMIDSDLQYNPEDLPKMLAKLEEGYDIVNGRRNFSHYPRWRRIISKVYNIIARKTIGYSGHDLNCGIKVFRREVIESMRLRPGYHRYIVALAERNGFKATEMNVKLSPRLSGKSSYPSTGRILEGAIDLIALRIRFSFEKRPMLLFGVSGITLVSLGLGIGGYLGYLALVLGQSITLRPLTLIAVFLFVTGVQFLSLGLISEMLLGVRDQVASLITDRGPLSKGVEDEKK